MIPLNSLGIQKKITDVKTNIIRFFLISYLGHANLYLNFLLKTLNKVFSKRFVTRYKALLSHKYLCIIISSKHQESTKYAAKIMAEFMTE